jgi:hypothetical protein
LHLHFLLFLRRRSFGRTFMDFFHDRLFPPVFFIIGRSKFLSTFSMDSLLGEVFKNIEKSQPSFAGECWLVFSGLHPLFYRRDP